VPGADTIAPLSLKVGLVVDARDDHGVTGVEIESRRISRLGIADPPRREKLAVPPEGPDRAILTYTLDLNRRGLLPGDTVRYFALATDNTPDRQFGRSQEFVLRLPTMSEVRAAQRLATEEVAGRLDSIAESSRRLERQTEDLARERPRDRQGGDRSGESLSFEQSKRAETVAQNQQELMRQAEELKESLEALRKSAEAAGLADSAWQRQLQEIGEQLQRALTPSCGSGWRRCSGRRDLDRSRQGRLSGWPGRSGLREALGRSRLQARRAGGRPGQPHSGVEELARDQRAK
jgi:hypothetical protein